jgi:hypothetical protein
MKATVLGIVLGLAVFCNGAVNPASELDLHKVAEILGMNSQQIEKLQMMQKMILENREEHPDVGASTVR